MAVKTYAELYNNRFKKMKDLLTDMHHKEQFRSVLDTFEMTDISKIPLPTSWDTSFIYDLANSKEIDSIDDDNSIIYRTDERQQIHIEGIDEQYYSELNGTDVLLWKGDLQWRKYDYMSKYMKDENGNYIYKDTKSSISNTQKVLSPIDIGVPAKYTPTVDGFNYVDFYADTPDGFKATDTLEEAEQLGKVYRLYTIPNQYCYRMKSTALILAPSTTRRFKFFKAKVLPFVTGEYLTLGYVEKPRQSASSDKTYRLITIRGDLEYDILMKQLIKFWVDNKIVFHPDNFINQDTTRFRNRIYPFADIEPADGSYIFESYDIDKPIGVAEESIITGNINTEGE